MLKKSFFSPTQPWRAETRLFPCGVLALFRPSTYPRGYVEGLHSLRPSWTNFLSILREGLTILPQVKTIEVLAWQHCFSAACK